MVELEKLQFDAVAFLASAGAGRRIIQLTPKDTFFSQGDPADSVFYIQKGRARVTVVSSAGKEATIALLSQGDFVGEEAFATVVGLRLATATAITACTTLKISREEMIRVMHVEHSFQDLFLRVILERSMRIQADLVDQIFNSSEKRLARILLLMAELGKPGEQETFIPPISQETLAEMVGTTRSRVSFFMNRFRRLGFIEYKGRIKVHKSLLNAVLLDRLPEVNRQKPPASAAARTRSKPARSVAGAELSKFELGVVSTARIRTHVRAERKAGFSTIGAALALKPLRTDSVSRGLSISLFTRETIFLSISVWPFLFMKRPFFER